MNNAIDINTYNFTNNDTLFIDANIWVDVYGPQGRVTDRIKAYSNALKNIITAKSIIYIDVLIISEFINTYSRLIYNTTFKTKYSKFKAFRQSPDFQSVAKDIAIATRNIMNFCNPSTSLFESMNINSVLTEYENGNNDFNDQVIANLCVTKGLQLITHDADFASSNLTILTANNKILTTSAV